MGVVLTGRDLGIGHRNRLLRRWRPALTFLAVALVALMLVRWMQVRAGAEHSSFGAYPDEPSHYLSGLMVRDYIADGFPGPPVKFAVNYYLHIPFFAVGHWPPLFYILEALWMILIGQSHSAVLWLIASITALVAATIFQEARRFVGVPGAACAGLLFCWMPDVHWSNNLVMTDTSVALLSLWAALLLGRYLDRGRPAFAFGFGLLAGLTILTKYSGLFLAVLPLSAVVLCRRWGLLRRWSFWLQFAVIAMIVLPWVALTHRYARSGLEPSQLMSFNKVESYAKLLLLQNGSGLGILLMLCWILTLLHWRKLSGMEGVLFLQVPAVLLLIMAAPVGVEGRYLIPAFPPLLLLMCFTIRRLSDWAKIRQVVFARPWATAILVAFTLFYGRSELLSFPHVPPNEMRPIVDFVLQSKDLRKASILVPANAEGPMIAEFAMRDPARAERILARPNKLLSRTDWMGTEYQVYYTTPSEAEQYFEQNPIDLVIVRKLPQGKVLPAEFFLAAVVKQYPERWKSVAEFPGKEGGYEVFQFARPAVWNQPTPFFVERLTSSLGN